ncbi:hypothetical protein BJX62DRAFT_245829 [Aspergillus germanicus]
MPRGRPRVYETDAARKDARNRRRRQQRQQPLAVVRSSPAPDPLFCHPSVTYENNITTVTSTEPDPFTDLSESLHGISVYEAVPENASPVTPGPAVQGEDEGAWSGDESEVMSVAGVEVPEGAFLASSPIFERRPSTPTAPRERRPATQHLAQQLAEQLLQHHGCMDHSDHGPQSTPTVTLANLTNMDCPDVLSRPEIQPYPVDWDQLLPAPARRQLFSDLALTRG